ncbi:tyrosine phosphatase isoform [Trypanosoma theileri]|uniref:Tyrosine phosphatase isoform n=1 Tax=Trypanosoma theileri TaxID=67003 RepID=A0A1X0PAB6_9TRYP|nr:tyrosine phosphatase isoform [Trypanosoma theileri]ORC93563.1 tyrosine phosphatase isoform [Trypanosoma theileri]
MTVPTVVGHYETPLLSQNEERTQRTQLLAENENMKNDKNSQITWSTSVSVDDGDKLYLQDFTTLSSSVLVEPNLEDHFSINFGSKEITRFNSYLDCMVHFIRSLTVQLLLISLITLNCIFVLYGYFSDVGQLIPFNVILAFIVLVGDLLILIRDRQYHFNPPCNRKQIIIADFCLFLSFLLELITLTVWWVTKDVLVILTGFPAAVLLYYPQFRCFTLALRHFVSADRRRYCANGFDLDLTFIDSTVVATSWPASKFESLFRNPAREVENLLDIKYGIHAYHVFNLCAERNYDNPALFHGDVSRYPMDDHNPAELEMMINFVLEATAFIQRDPRNQCIVVHCKGGKGRTGTMVCAYLIYTGMKRTADEALEYFGSMRTAKGGKFQGVQTPSQERYVRYFAQLISSRTPNVGLTVKSQTKRITQFMLLNIPSFWWKGGIGKLWFVIILKPCTERRVVYISNPNVNFNVHSPICSSTEVWNQLRDVYIQSEDSLYSDAQNINSEENVCSYYDTFTVNLSHTEMSSAEFDNQYINSNVVNNIDLKVSLNVPQLERLPPLTGDVVIKFYYLKKNVTSIEAPVQLWFHTSMEGDQLYFDKSKLDGPHKDTKGKRYPSDFAVMINLQNEFDSNE